MRTIGLLFFLVALNDLAAQNVEIDSIKASLPQQTGIDRIKSLNELSWFYKNIHVDSAYQFARSALDLSLQMDSKKAIASSYNSLANALEAKGDLDSARILHNASLALKLELDDSLGIADSYNNLGIVYDEQGKYDQALTHYFEALKIFEVVEGQEFNVAMALGNIGIVYKKQKEYQKVLEYYTRALSIYEEVGSEFGIMVTKGNIGSVMLETGDYRNSIAYSEEAMRAYEAAGYLRYVPYMKSNIGIALDSLRDHEHARTYYLEAIAEHTDLGNEYELASTLVLLASNYNITGDFVASAGRAEEAYNIASAMDAQEFQFKALNEWSKALAGQGRFEDAYSSILQRNEIKDRMFEASKTKQIFELQTQYETEKKEQQIALQEAQISEKQAQLQRAQYLAIALVVTVLSLSALWLLNRSRLRKKQQILLQQEKLHIKEAEINATISSQEMERARYARDLHDGFGQMISILNMNLGNLKSNSKPAERQQVFEESERVIKDMYDELKGICFDLMPQTLVKSGLQSGLTEFAERINKTGKVFIETDFFGLSKRLTEIQEISIYRISQEWINNILKYSDADKITLQVTADDNEITLLIEDNGQGFDKSVLTDSKGNGWKNLSTRTNLIQGALEIDTQAGKRGNALIMNAPAQIKAPKPAQENTISTV